MEQTHLFQEEAVDDELPLKTGVNQADRVVSATPLDCNRRSFFYCNGLQI